MGATRGVANANARTILVVGDSISAAYGLDLDQGWVSLLQRRLNDQGYGYRVINASVSGETTAGGLNRLPRALSLHRPAIVILELGGNDGLRGLSLTTTRANLNSMIRLSQSSSARVLLVGMKIPPNYGARYADAFAQLFADLAQQRKVAWVPFLMPGVALNPALMQNDGIHPNVAAQPLLLQTLWPALCPLLAATRPCTVASDGARSRLPAATRER